MQTQSLSTKTLPPMITCECGKMLSRMNIEDAFAKPVECDNCEKKLNVSDVAYHCISSHVYCLKCSKSLLLNINNKGLINPIYCACREQMILTQPSVTYSSGASCNNTTCRAKIDRMEYCYHCPKGKSSVHPKGYDYCMKCAKQKSMFGYVMNNKRKTYKNNKNKQSKVKKGIFDNISDIKTSSIVDTTKIITSSTVDATAIQSLNVNPMPLIQSQNNMEQTILRLREKLESVGKDYLYLNTVILDNIQIACKCKAQLMLTKPYIVYSGPARCDICQCNIPQDDITFHCPKEKSIYHDHGYDVCLDCAVGNKQQYEKYEQLMMEQCKKLKHYEKVIKPEVMMIFEGNKRKINKSTESIISIMPYMMDVQNKVFKQIMNRINGMDEEPGNIKEEKNDSDIDKDNKDEEDEGSDSSDMYDGESEEERKPLINNEMKEIKKEKLSLKQLYLMRNKLNETIKKQEKVSISICKLSECINYRCNDNECEWESWSADDIVDWIMELENGRFKVYEEILRKELNDGDATGAILPHLDISDWRKSFAIKNWKDAVDLNKYKDILVTNKKEDIDQEQESVVQHNYISPFDPDEEGANTK